MLLHNIRYAFQYHPVGFRRALFWEWLHSTLIALPSGLLIVVFWEWFSPSPNPNTLWAVVATLSTVFFLQLYVAPRAMINSNKATFEVSRKLRLALGNKLQRLSLGYYKQRSSDELATVALQDVADFENIFGHTVANIANALFGTLTLGIVLLILDWQLGLTLLAALLLAAPLIWGAQRLVQYYSTQMIEARTQASRHFMEYLRGIRSLKAYGMTGSKFQKLEQALYQLYRKSLNIEAIPGPIVLFTGVVFELFFIGMIWWGLYRYTGGSLTLPIWVAFLILGYRLYEPLKVIMVEVPILSYMNVSLTRIIDVLEAPEQSAGKRCIPECYDIEFQNVQFGYQNDQPVLQDVSFQLPECSMTALVGASGSGKTTITALIARFWDVQKGSIKIGGIDLKDMAPAAVYNLVSEVFQEVYLFDGSIYENILIGNPKATDDDVQQAAQQAQVLEFAHDLPNGLHSSVGEGGAHLSGGQRQRISIARALLKDAPIILLDEATASLDPENERFIQKALQRLVQNKTVLVIAHRLATIAQADQILVLKQGKIVEQGTHKQLLKQPEGHYAHLWSRQQQIKGWKFETSDTTN